MKRKRMILSHSSSSRVNEGNARREVSSGVLRSVHTLGQDDSMTLACQIK